MYGVVCFCPSVVINAGFRLSHSYKWRPHLFSKALQNFMIILCDVTIIIMAAGFLECNVLSWGNFSVLTLPYFRNIETVLAGVMSSVMIARKFRFVWWQAGISCPRYEGERNGRKDSETSGWHRPVDAPWGWSCLRHATRTGQRSSQARDSDSWVESGFRD